MNKLKELKTIITICFFLFGIIYSNSNFSQHFRIGISAGQESRASAPRIGFSYPVYSKSNFEISTGADVGVWLINSFSYSSSIHANFRYNKYAIEPSLGFWHQRNESVNFDHKQLVFTPKIGKDFKYWAFRVGPSFVLWNQDSRPIEIPVNQIISVNNISLNFDVRIRIPWSIFQSDSEEKIH